MASETKLNRTRIRLKLLLCFTLWIGLFGLGLFIDSGPFREELINPTLTPIQADPYAGVTDYVTWIDPATITAPRNWPSQLHWHYSIEAVLVFTIAFLAYTPTNLAMLCCLAAMLGSAGRRLGRKSPRKLRFDEPADDELSPQPEVKIASSLLRGFCVYLLLISGLIVLTGSPFDAPTQEAYIRLAGAASILSFVAGFRQDFFPSGLRQLGNQA